MNIILENKNFFEKINQLDGILKEMFSVVEYNFESDMDVYISCKTPNSSFLTESNRLNINVGLFKLNLKLPFSSLLVESNWYTPKSINWRYASNPDTEQFWVVKRSSLETIKFDFVDILKNNRFESGYMESVVATEINTAKDELIKESVDNVSMFDIIDGLDITVSDKFISNLRKFERVEIDSTRNMVEFVFESDTKINDMLYAYMMIEKQNTGLSNQIVDDIYTDTLNNKITVFINPLCKLLSK